MKKTIALLLALSFLAVGLVSCREANGATTVSVDNTTTTDDLYSATPAGAAGSRNCNPQASFRDDTYWYYVYYLGRVTGIPVSYSTANWFHYTGNAEITKELTITEMSGETVAKSIESANSVTDGWSAELSSALTASLSATIGSQISVGASAGLDIFQAGVETTTSTSVTGTLEAGLTKKYGFSSAKQNTLIQYKATEKQKTLTIEKSMTFRFIPSETKVGFYNFVTMGIADVFAVVIYDPAEGTASITSVSEWVSLYDELVYSEDSILEITTPDTLTLDTDSLRFEEPGRLTTSQAYKVLYNAYGGEGTMQDSTFTYNVDKSLDVSTFYRSGYKFLGWSTNPHDKDPMYTDAQNVKNLASGGETVTLYAVWLKVEFVHKHTTQVNLNEKEPKTIKIDLSSQLDLERIAKYCSTATVTSTFTTNNGEGNDKDVDRTVKLIGVSATGKETEIFRKTYAAEYGSHTHTEEGTGIAVSCFTDYIYYHLSAYRSGPINTRSGFNNATTTIVFS